MKHSNIYEKVIQQAMEMVGCSFFQDLGTTASLSLAVPGTVY
jgi:hypothetical protein